MSEAANELKAQGNDLFKASQFGEALKIYEKALKSSEIEESQKVAIHKNVAACYLKLNKPKKAVEHCTQALEVAPGDVKALFRRSQAYEALQDYDNAFTDMAKASQLENKNLGFAREANRLMQIVAKRLDHKRSTAGISEDMIGMALSETDPKKRMKAVHNCVALSNEPAGSDKLFLQGASTKLLPLLQDEDSQIVELILHTYANLAENHLARALSIYNTFASSDAKTLLMSLVKSKNDKIVRAAVRVYHMLVTGLADLTQCPGDLLSAAQMARDSTLKSLIRFVSGRGLPAAARDAAIAALVKQTKSKDVAYRMLELGAISSLLITAALAKPPFASEKTVSMDTSNATRGEIAVALQQMHEATKEKGQSHPSFVEQCKAQIKFGDTPESSIPAANALITIMIAVVDIGNEVLEETDAFARLMAMAKSSDLAAQCLAAEALSYAASDKKRARGIMMEGFPILKKLYAKDLPDEIRVRALCGLCKMSAVSGGAPNLRSFSEGSLINLAKKLRPFLVVSEEDSDIRRWAAEAMAYLSLDADVKELVIEDEEILKAVHSVCLKGDSTLQYALANMLVNLTNSYDMPEVSEEQEQLKQLGKYVGENLPEPHEKDSDDFKKKRVKKLIESKFVTALVELAKSESKGVKELVARVFLAMTEDMTNRGVVVAEGGAKALLPLTRENTEKGILKASQALAKIAITSNPAIAFPGQRAAELVKPLIALSRERKGLLQFESCMALCNLASMSDDMRLKILREKGVSRLEDLMFDEDILVQRAAVEALVNCFYTDKIFDMFATKDGESWSRIKLWILLSGVEQDEFDLPLCRAASGGLALLSSSPDVCWRIKEEKQGHQILKELLVSGESDLQHRALHIIRNMVNTDKKLAEMFTEEESLLILSALFLTSKTEAVKTYSKEILERLQESGLITSTNDVIRNAHSRAFELTHVKDRMHAEAQALAEEDEEDDDEEEEEEEAEEVDLEPEEEEDDDDEPRIIEIPDDDESTA